MTVHIPTKDPEAPNQLCPGIRIHAIDMIQPPGIRILPIADIDRHQTIVSATLATKTNTETQKKARGDP
jgi:hypothetical protein